MLLTRAERRLIRRRRRRRAIAALAAAVALLAWAAAQHAGTARPHRAGVPSPPAARTPHPHRKQNGTGPVPVLAAQPDLTWAAFDGIALPVSKKDGPRRTRHGLVWGFADTPAGALLAAVNIAVRTAAPFGPAIYTPTIHRQVTGSGKRALLQGDASAYAALRAAARIPPGQPAGRIYAAITAYRFESWSRAGAVVDVVSEAPSPSGHIAMTATRIEVVWRDGDWRVVVPPGGDWAREAAALSSLTGFSAFPNPR